ncbi:MAG: glutamate--tRNA ligase [Anaerolineales bacterium]|jgi:glutamyl-tRNA synthetase
MDRNQMKPVRVRFAPSPTGRTHLGSGRTALYNYLLARQSGGQFILRIEDTDRKRYNPESEKELIDSLHWLGIQWDEGPDIGGPHAPYHQSERKEIYLQHAAKLVEMGHAYYCFCTPQRLAEMRQNQQRNKLPSHYDGTCRRIPPEESARRIAEGEPHVIRFKTPQQGSITVYDTLRGDITVENENIDDYIIVKSDGLALYHLAAMVDDHLMNITHVIRGSEWLPTFPLHAHIIRAFGWQEPEWIHLSLFLKPSGKGKMSKRDTNQLIKDGFSIYLTDLASLGYLPEGVLNWTALMGWSYDDHTEFFTLPDLVEKFTIERLNPSPAAINFTKLDHFNGLHIRSLEVPDLAERLKPFFLKAGYEVGDQKLLKVTPLIQQRIVTLEDATEMGGFFFEDEVHPLPEDLVGKNMSPGESAEAARLAYDVLKEMPEINKELAEEPMRATADQLGLKAGQLFGILRVAVTGRTVSPPLFETMAVIGKETVLERIQAAIEMLDTLNNQG